MVLRLIAAGCLLAIPAAGLVATAAWADPAGCSTRTASFGLQSNRTLAVLGEGSCNSVASRNLQVGIKQDISFAPDPVVTHSNDNNNASFFSVFAESCDNGRTASYYGRTFFTTNTTFHDSAHHNFSVC
jgi:hypothetical protein